MSRRFFRFFHFGSKILRAALSEESRSLLTISAVGIGVKTISTLNTSNVNRETQKISVTNEDLQVESDHQLSRRELRFLHFASVEYNDIIYMTPMDFVDSLTLDTPRERVYRRVLKEADVKSMLSITPLLKKGTKTLLRELDQNGIISYAEYIFLLTLLTKSEHGFQIAFSLFDKDDNGKIEKDEFMLLEYLITSLKARNVPKFENEKRQQDTTLLLHLFGPRGANSISFEQFKIFYQNLQRELMEIEFYEFSRGKTEISPVDFARLLLRYSVVRRDDYAKYIQRVRERTDPCDQGIDLDSFEEFFLFLNNLEEFTAAVRLYTVAEIPVSQAEFIRAVKASTSYELDEYLVELIYRIFDANDDNRLSYSEFIAIMNDRLHRGLKSPAYSTSMFGWQSYKQCVINELARF